MAFNFRRIQQGGLTIMPQSADTTSELGDLQVLSSTNEIVFNNGSGSSPLLTAINTATVSNKTFLSPLILTQTATPANPPSGENSLYFKNDNGLYILDSAGVEIQVAGPTAVFFDSSLEIQNTADNSKIAEFSVASISPSTIRTFTFPDASGTLVLTNNPQTLSNKTLDNTNILTIKDSNLLIQNNADLTKEIKFDLSNITTATTRTYTFPDLNTTLIGPYNIRTESTTYTAIANDYILATAASSWTLTLPTAIGIAGQVISVKRTDLVANSLITITTTSAQNIDGLSNVYLYTQGEEYTFVSNGSNWSIQSHKCTTQWISYPLSITGSIANPTKGTNIVNDSAFWRRVGDSMEITYTYYQSNGAGGDGGSGVYLFSVPVGFGSMNTSIVTTSTDTTNFALGTIVGSAIMFSTTSSDGGIIEPYNSSNLYILMPNPRNAVLGQANYTLAGPATYTFRATIPIINWLP